jgi:poly-beta-1,6-N-acetyl-D-glucosamine synthase
MRGEGDSPQLRFGQSGGRPARLDHVAKRRTHRLHTEECVWLATFVLSVFLVAWAIQQLLEWPGTLADAGASPLLRYAVVAMAIIAVFSASRWSILFVLSFVARRRTLQRPISEPCDWPFVSILVPCFNEVQAISAALESLLELDYPKYEVIVIDDGSTDQTALRAAEFEGEHGGCSVRVYRKSNGGKWTALNFGFGKAKGSLILCVDADSRLAPGSLKRCIAHMADPIVSAVAGQVRVRNQTTLITRLQALEYLMCNGSMRLGQGLFHSVMVIPGPIGLFRRSVLEHVSIWHGAGPSAPFEGDTFAEDFDLSMAILCSGGRIAYEPEAISYTKVPDRLFTLINQRYRWIRGSLQVLRKFGRRATADPHVLSPRLLVWTAWVYVPDCLFTPIASLIAPLVFLALLLTGMDFGPMFVWYAASLLLQASAGALFVVVHRDRATTLAVLPALALYGGSVILCAWLISVVDEMRAAPMRW